MVIILNFLFKIAGNINHGYSPLKIFCRRSCHFFLFMGERYAYHMCVQNGWDGGHWSLLRKFYGRNHNLIDCYGISVSQMTTEKFHLSQTLLGPFLVHHLSNNTN
jgi:hypothetical protein